MEVILLENIINVGQLGDLVKVKNGYARNYLIPQNKAKLANSVNRAEFEKNRAEYEKRIQDSEQKAKLLQEKIKDKTFNIKASSNEDGKLFGSIGSKEIAELLVENGYEIEPKQIILSEGVFRQVGSFAVHIQIYQDIQAQITLEIAAE